MAGHHADSHAGRALRRGALAVALATGTAGAGLLAAELHDETVAVMAAIYRGHGAARSR